MADLIQRRRFERPSLPQHGWQTALGLYTPTPPTQAQIWPALLQETESRRADAHVEYQQQYYTQPAFSWLFTPLGLVELKRVLAPINQLRESFRADSAQLLLSPLLTQPQTNAWYFKASVDAILSTYHPVFKQQANSFRAAPQQKLSLEQHLTEPLFTPWLRDSLSLPNAHLPIYVVEGIIG